MAIQNRRGAHSDFDPTKMLAGEYAVVLSGDPDDVDGYAVYMCFAPGVVRKLVFAEQLDTIIDDAITNKQDVLTFDSTPALGSTNPVTSGGIKIALNAKQDALTFDNTPTLNSDNPVKSNGIKTILDEIETTLDAVDFTDRIKKGTATNSLIIGKISDNVASGSSSLAQGIGVRAGANGAHAEGYQSVASGAYSHAEGYVTTAASIYSHAEGNHTTANGRSQHVLGEYNIPDRQLVGSRSTYIEIVGNGTSSTASNARTLDWNGNEILAGKLTVGASPTANMDVTTKQYVDEKIEARISESLKTALLQIASKVAYTDENGQDYYDDLYNALYPSVNA